RRPHDRLWRIGQSRLVVGQLEGGASELDAARFVRKIPRGGRTPSPANRQRSRRDLPGRRVRKSRPLSRAVDRQAMTPTAELVADTRCAVGESPVWDQRDQRLYWVDIDGATIYRLEHDGTTRAWKMPEKVGCIAPHVGGGWIAAMRATVRRVHLHEDGRAENEVLATVQHLASPMRFNDGRCDRQGRFWVGTIFEDTKAGNDSGRMYRYAGKAGLEFSGIDKLIVANGLAWSPDGRTMYLADSWSGSRLIWAFDYDTATGTPRNRRVFVD